MIFDKAYDAMQEKFLFRKYTNNNFLKTTFDIES